MRGTVQPPWDRNPYKLVSWWDMEKFAAAPFYNLLRDIGTFQQAADRELKDGTREISFADDLRQEMRYLAEDAEKNCKRIGLSLAAKAAANFGRLVDGPEPVDMAKLRCALLQMENNVEWEMEDTLFFHTPSDRAAFYDNQLLFGQPVNSKFPSIYFDMVEAGNCYALGRGTACVFHLMRIMEIGVQQFGARLGLSLVNEKNWQNLLDEANKAIKTISSKATDAPQLSQVAANLYAVKLAWRNEVMHPNATYTLEEAGNILQQVKMFMHNLAGVL